jgi:hypothetical protein
MRELTPSELADLRARCRGLDGTNLLTEGGRWLCEHLVMHWTSEDVLVAIYGRAGAKQDQTRKKNQK